METKIVYDTNVLLYHPDVILEKPCAVSFTTLRELDSLKRRPDLKFMAQHAIKSLKHAFRSGMVEILNVPSKDSLDPSSPDEQIILDCLKAGYRFSSEDIGATVIAKALGLILVDTDNDDYYDKDYTGYIYVDGDLNYESQYVAVKDMQKAEFETIFSVTLKENQYAIIKRVVPDKEDIWVAKGDTVSRISQTMKPYKSADIMDVPMDSVQMAVLDAIFDTDIPLTIIDGKVGSGKTMLSLMAAIARTGGQRVFSAYETISVTRPNITTDDRYKRGFLPGDAHEKDAPWIAGITSNLKFLFEKTRDQKKKEIGTAKFAELFEIIPMETIQGLSLNNSILLVDEYQLLNTDGILLVLSRIAQGSKVVLIGDTRAQTYHINRGDEGFKLLQPHYGNKALMNFVRMDKVYRSPLAEFVAELMNEL